MITNKFIHVHIPRTAGQFIRARIRERQSCWPFLINFSHLTLDESREKLAKQNPKLVGKVPSFCIIRNPWDWYVSRFFFRQKEWRREGNAPFCDIENFSNDKKGFQKHMRLLKTLIESGEKPQEMNGRHVPRIWLRPTISKFYEDLACDGINYLGRFEQLDTDLVNILNTLDPQAFKRKDLSAKMKRKFNDSKHAAYQHYYDKELEGWVHEWDKRYIEAFDYEF